MSSCVGGGGARRRTGAHADRRDCALRAGGRARGLAVVAAVVEVLLERPPPPPPPPPPLAAEHLHPLADDPQLGVLLAVFFPLIELQPALDQHRRALAQVLAGDFGRAAPQRDIDERRFLDPFAAAGSCGDRSRPGRCRSPPCRFAGSVTSMSRVRLPSRITRLKLAIAKPSCDSMREVNNRHKPAAYRTHPSPQAAQVADPASSRLLLRHVQGSRAAGVRAGPRSAPVRRSWACRHPWRARPGRPPAAARPSASGCRRIDSLIRSSRLNSASLRLSRRKYVSQ